MAKKQTSYRIEELQLKRLDTMAHDMGITNTMLIEEVLDLAYDIYCVHFALSKAKAESSNYDLRQDLLSLSSRFFQRIEERMSARE